MSLPGREPGRPDLSSGGPAAGESASEAAMQSAPPQAVDPCRPRRASIRRRILAAFVLLALGLGLTLGLVGVFSYDRLGAYLVGWHARPIMEALMEAERRAWEAEDRGRGNLYYGDDLAAAMHWRFFVGKQVPEAWRALPEGLHFFNQMEEFALIVRRNGLDYVLSGHTGAFQALKNRLGALLLLCVLAGLGVAVVLGLLLGRRLTAPLSRLTRAVESRAPHDLLAPDAPGPRASPVPPISPIPPIPLTELEDEVGVLARALAAREEALQRFVLRESFFTGDVSHELRTPLTVMQGGLEILELRLDGLEGGAQLKPVLARLLRTTARMTDTVRTLLLLARRPEDIERIPLDLSEQLRALIRELERDGALRHAAERRPATAAIPGGPALLCATISPGVRALGQRELTTIIFKNLLDNARQYTENNHVYVRLTPGMLEVRNSGRIPGELDIFARGVRGARHGQGAATPRGSAGSGLGLSLTLRACEHLGWHVLRADAPQGETIFRVTFPPYQGETE